MACCRLLQFLLMIICSALLGAADPNQAPEAYFAALRQEADAGSCEAQLSMGIQLGRDAEFDANEAPKPDPVAAVGYLQAAAAQANAQALYWLSILHDEGRGVPQNGAEALRLVRLAAEQGDGMAQGTLGNRYQFGWQVLQDDREALRWYRRAAEQGNYSGVHGLARCLRQGIGCRADPVQACAWLQVIPKIMRSEDDTATFTAGLSPEQQAEALRIGKELAAKYSEQAIRDNRLALEWCRSAAEQGDPNGILGLAQRLHTGIGCQADPVQAYAWILVARKTLGFESYAATLAADLSPEQQAEALRLSKELAAGSAKRKTAP